MAKAEHAIEIRRCDDCGHVWGVVVEGIELLEALARARDNAELRESRWRIAAAIGWTAAAALAAALLLDVMNGERLLVGPESGDALLGERLYADLTDHGDEGYAELARRVEALPHAQRVALEVWAMMLWERSDDDAYWEAELAKRALTPP